MTSLRISCILFAVILTQSVLCKPVHSSDEIDRALKVVNTDPSASEKLLVLVIDNLMTIPKQYAANAVTTTQHLLKDKAVENNNESDIQEFKNKLNMVLHVYDASASKMKSFYQTMDSFANVCEYYYQLPEDKLTADTKLIVGLLDKYNCKNVAIKLADHLDTFFVMFNKMFEDNKFDLEQPILEWYEKFVKLTDLHQKMQSIIVFIDLA
ncbi:uncharacterized protein LOC135952350 [Calliphora vicina]|uniref:uncharacterized protein LOC135952350 n=1 Tax=Calliphora vicina TaxID=7373 RepID=UPI00325B5F8A